MNRKFVTISYLGNELLHISMLNHASSYLEADFTMEVSAGCNLDWTI